MVVDGDVGERPGRLELELRPLVVLEERDDARDHVRVDHLLVRRVALRRRRQAARARGANTSREMSASHFPLLIWGRAMVGVAQASSTHTREEITRRSERRAARPVTRLRLEQLADLGHPLQ